MPFHVLVRINARCNPEFRQTRYAHCKAMYGLCKTYVRALDRVTEKTLVNRW